VGAFSGEKGWGSLQGISLHHGVRVIKGHAIYGEWGA